MLPKSVRIEKRLKECHLLVDGYIRSLQSNLDKMIPEVISALCFESYYIDDPNSYTWIISDKSMMDAMKIASPVKSWTSDTFELSNLKWHLRIYPGGADYTHNRRGFVVLYFYLVAFPPQIQSISMIYTLRCVEADIQYTHAPVLTKNLNFGGWNEQLLPSADLQNLDRLTLSLEISITAIIDKNGADITDEYIGNVWSIKSEDYSEWSLISQRMDELTERVSKMEGILNGMQTNDTKQNDDDEGLEVMMKKFKSIKDRLNGSSKLDEKDSNKLVLKVWLENKVRLSSYYPMLIQNGVEDLETVSLLTDGDLQKLGINKVGHRKKLLHYIEQLKQQRSNEGNTNHM